MIREQESRGVYISTYGCQMNVHDSERMYSILEMFNYTPVRTPEEASLIIINSCSVREKPVHKVHSEMGRYRKLKYNNPSLKIGVGGCVGQQEKDRLLKDIPILDFVFGPDNIDTLPKIIAKVQKHNERVAHAKFEHNKPYQIETLVRNPGISTFVNITKGCDNFCTFCVVPFTRGRLRSRPLRELVSDVQSLVRRNVKEVTLLGQNVNSYLSDCGADFSDLLRILCEDTNIQRIRYTTSHPKDFDQKLIDISAQYRVKICDYVHLPVQSGNSRILNMMNRGYTREDYIYKAKMILEGIPGVSFSTDIIVGFPGETECEFEDTMTLLDEVPYESLFAFKYSPRPYTKAARYKDQIEEVEKQRRLAALFKKHREISFKLAKCYENKVLEVLVEKVDKNNPYVVIGRSTQNKVVYFSGSSVDIGKTLPVRVLKAFPQTLRGERVDTRAVDSVS